MHPAILESEMRGGIKGISETVDCGQENVLGRCQQFLAYTLEKMM